MNFVEWSAGVDDMAAQMQSSPYYRGPAVVYVPPGYSQPAPPPPVQARRPPPQPRALTQDQERDRVIDAGEAFCRRYKSDPICHPLPQGEPPQ